MMRLLVPLLLVAAAGVTLYEWYRQRYEPGNENAPPAAVEAAPAAGPAFDPTWLREALGAGDAPPAPAAIDAALRRWPPIAELNGLDQLGGSAASSAASRELVRWLDLAPAGSVRVRSLELAPTADGRSFDMRLALAGPPPAVVPMLRHLLRLPTGRGYLTDVSRLALVHEGEDGVRLELVQRVHPAGNFLPKETP